MAADIEMAEDIVEKEQNKFKSKTMKSGVDPIPPVPEVN